MLIRFGKRTANLHNALQGQTSGFFAEKERERELDHAKEKVVPKQTPFERESDKICSTTLKCDAGEGHPALPNAAEFNV